MSHNSAGYCGGVKPNPTYDETCQKLTSGQHAEVVRVIYYPDQITVSTYDVIIDDSL